MIVRSLGEGTQHSRWLETGCRLLGVRALTAAETAMVLQDALRNRETGCQLVRGGAQVAGGTMTGRSRRGQKQRHGRTDQTQKGSRAHEQTAVTQKAVMRMLAPLPKEAGERQATGT